MYENAGSNGGIKITIFWNIKQTGRQVPKIGKNVLPPLSSWKITFFYPEDGRQSISFFKILIYVCRNVRWHIPEGP
jgi:hypothetical protein